MTSLAILNLFGRKIILDNFSTTQYYIKSSSKVKVGSERAIRKWGVLGKTEAHHQNWDNYDQNATDADVSTKPYGARGRWTLVQPRASGVLLL